MVAGNEPPDLSGISPAELGRMVRDVLMRFEGLAARLETGFVRSDNFDYYKQLIDSSIQQLRAALSTAADKSIVEEKIKELNSELEKRATKSAFDELGKRISELEDDKKWLVRIVLFFVITMVLTGSVAVAKLTGGG